MKFPETHKKFALGDAVRKIKGSQWHGHIVGWYSTCLTPEGYAVESATENGSVQIYPAAALELWDGGVGRRCEMSHAAVAAIQYALDNRDESPMEFLHCWMHGDFDVIRREWENVPDEVFIGADPLFQPKEELK